MSKYGQHHPTPKQKTGYPFPHLNTFRNSLNEVAWNIRAPLTARLFLDMRQTFELITDSILAPKL